jgi:hypothetical protein
MMLKKPIPVSRNVEGSGTVVGVPCTSKAGEWDVRKSKLVADVSLSDNPRVVVVVLMPQPRKLSPASAPV